MAKSIFEKMESVQEVNRMAAQLRRLGMKEKLKELADKNHVMNQDLEDFLQGKRYFLIDAGETIKSYDTARAKLMDEMLTLNDPLFGTVIGGYLLQCCGKEEFQEAVLQEHKTLQRCIEYVMEKAYELLGEDQKKARRNAAVAVVSDQVFEWAKGYYALDDKVALEEKRKKAEEAFQNRNKPKTSPAKGTSKRKTSKTSKKKTGIVVAKTDFSKEQEEQKRADSRESHPDSWGENIGKGETEIPEKKLPTTEKGQIEGQVSLFHMEPAA